VVAVKEEKNDSIVYEYDEMIASEHVYGEEIINGMNFDDLFIYATGICEDDSILVRVNKNPESKARQLFTNEQLENAIMEDVRCHIRQVFGA